MTRSGASAGAAGAGNRPAIELVLASASPRRRELLARAGIVFTIEPAAIDERVAAGTPAERAALELACAKARAVAARRFAAGRPAALVLGADTIVVLGQGQDERLLGKPRDASEARAMLAALSGSRHRVITGVCALAPARGDGRAPSGPSGSAGEGTPGAGSPGEHTGAETTWVTMRVISARELDAYAASAEWRDKAGGYAIQESADRFVTRLEGGGFDNVVGLPLALALALLERAAAEGRGSV